MILIIKVRVGCYKPLPRIYSAPALKIALPEVPWWDVAVPPCSHYFGIQVLYSEVPEKSVFSFNLKRARRDFFHRVQMVAALCVLSDMFTLYSLHHPPPLHYLYHFLF